MNYEEILLECETKMEDSITSMDKRFTNVRAGRANPSMLDGITVEYYGTETPLKQLANISVPEARQITIKPFDKSILGDIEKAIFEANIGITPNNNGEVIFLVIPALTEDRRRELVKLAKATCEEGKVSIRNNRHDSLEMLESADLPEDTLKRSEDRVQEIVNKYNKIVDSILEEKTKDLMSV